MAEPRKASLPGHAWRWLFRAPRAERAPWEVVAWWEARRIPYNVLVGAVGIAALAVYVACLTQSGELHPGEDALEPIALLAAPVLVNVCYTAGWGLELALRAGGVTDTRLGPALLKVGLLFSCFVVWLPALFWAIVWAWSVLP